MRFHENVSENCQLFTNQIENVLIENNIQYQPIISYSQWICENYKKFLNCPVYEIRSNLFNFILYLKYMNEYIQNQIHNSNIEEESLIYDLLVENLLCQISMFESFTMISKQLIGITTLVMLPEVKSYQVWKNERSTIALNSVN